MTQSRVLVITGATGGLGTALVRRLAAADYLIAATYLVPEEARALEEAVMLDEDRLFLSRVDSADTDEVESFMRETAERFGRIDALCCLAGKWAGGRDVADTDDVRFDRMIDSNLRSAFAAARAALPYLKQAEWKDLVHGEPRSEGHTDRTGGLQHRQSRSGRTRQVARPGAER